MEGPVQVCACLHLQEEFVCFAFGGPSEYSGEDLAAAHQPVIRKGATVFLFDVVVDHFLAVLTETGVTKVSRFSLSIGLRYSHTTCFSHSPAATYQRANLTSHLSDKASDKSRESASHYLHVRATGPVVLYAYT